MISKDKWAEIIKDFHKSKFPEMIERDIVIPTKIPLKRAISIIGPRRAGKTYEMFQLMKKLLMETKKEHLLYIDFERADLGVVEAKDLINMLETYYELYPKNKKIWMFLDEIQNVAGWEKFVRTALDENIKIYLSGSSSKMLSKEIATSMRGRNITYTMLPFSFKEYLKKRNFEYKKYFSSDEKAKIIYFLQDFMKYGGYPEAVIYPKEKEKILKEILETVIYKDVIERSRIRNVKVMKLIIGSLINSTEFSVNKFYKYLKSLGIKLGKSILYNYIEYLNDAFFVFMVRKFSYSYKHAEQSIPKPYFIDNGFLTISGIADKGRIMENLVFIELMRREANIWNYESFTKQKVDFVIKEKKKVKELIQVSYDIQNFNTKDREIKSLLKACKELRCNNLVVINWDYEGIEKYNNKKIIFVPLWKWLLEKR